MNFSYCNLLIISLTLYLASCGKEESNVIIKNDNTIKETSHTKTTLYLAPRKSAKPLGIMTSKMGGVPNLSGFKEWPTCTSCSLDLNFIMQLFKKDFPQFSFPEKMNLFQLFRCPNADCPSSYSEFSDHKMKWYYHKCIKTNKSKGLKQKLSKSNEIEAPIPECSLHPIEKIDNANYSDSLPQNWYGTKIGGYPSWTQNHLEFQCEKCNSNKDFLFQLSTMFGHRWGDSDTEFEEHGIEIGDSGNIYFFICKECGTDSIESTWDCE